MNKSEPVGEWLARQGRVHIRYGDAIELIQEIQEKKDNLGMEMREWVQFGDDVIGMVCDLFDIEKPKVNKDKRAEAITDVKIREKLRGYLKEAIRLQAESETLEEISESYLNTIDHRFTEAQRAIIWSDIWHDLSSVEKLEKAIEEMKIEEEVNG